jgi:hypothetical protein
VVSFQFPAREAHRFAGWEGDRGKFLFIDVDFGLGSRRHFSIHASFSVNVLCPGLKRKFGDHDDWDMLLT